MKSLIIILSLITAQISLANNSCLGEAQIIAKVSKIKKHTIMECVVEIEPASITHYNMNQLCPLDIDEVLATGINVGIKDGHDCTHNAGDTLTGILVKTPWEKIILN